MLKLGEKEESQRRSERSQGQLLEGPGGHRKDFGLYSE